MSSSVPLEIFVFVILLVKCKGRELLDVVHMFHVCFNSLSFLLALYTTLFGKNCHLN